MISHEALLEFVRLNKGRVFATPSQGNHFTCAVAGDAIIITRSTGTTKRVTNKRINLFCDRFNSIKSFVATDYHRDVTAAASQLLVLTKLLFEENSGATPSNTARTVVPPSDDANTAAHLNLPKAGPLCPMEILPPRRRDQLIVEKRAFEIMRDAGGCPKIAELDNMTKELCWDNRCGIDLNRSFIYFICVRDPSGREYRYVGRARNESRLQEYVKTVHRIFSGKPKTNSHPRYRAIHLALAKACEFGWPYDFYPIEAVEESELNNRERFHIQECKCNLNGASEWSVADYATVCVDTLIR